MSVYYALKAIQNETVILHPIPHQDIHNIMLMMKMEHIDIRPYHLTEISNTPGYRIYKFKNVLNDDTFAIHVDIDDVYNPVFYTNDTSGEIPNHTKSIKAAITKQKKCYA